MALFSLRPSSWSQARRGWGHASWGWTPTFHAAAFHCAEPSFLPLHPVSHIPFVLPQGRTEELEESSQCTLPTFPWKVSTVLWAPLCLMQGGHRWRRTNTVFDVSQAWSKLALLAHPALAQQFFPGFLSREAHQVWLALFLGC